MILDTYEQMSGQKVNLSKPSIIFGMKVEQSLRHRIQNNLQIHTVGGGGGKYL